MRVRSVLAVVTLLLAAACSEPGTPDGPPTTTAPAPVASGPARVVGYYSNWGVYARNFQVRDLETSGAAARLTHLLYAFGKVDKGTCAAGDAWADYQKPVTAEQSVDGVATAGGTIAQLRKLKARHPGLKIIWSFGGWTGSAGFTAAAQDPAKFAASCAELLNDQRWAGVFDGVDVDWEYPNACGETCDTSGPAALHGLLAALRRELGQEALVTAAVPGDPAKLAVSNYGAAAAEATWLGAMTYDFFGTGETPGPTAPHAPLTSYPGIPKASLTAESTVRTLRAQGVPAGKILLGVGFYGRGWTGVTSAGPGGTGTGPAAGSYEKGLEDYALLARSCPPTGTAGGTAYAFCGGQWWGYDTPGTIRSKMEWARGNGLGGAFAWELSGDTADAQLVAAMAAGLGVS